MTPSSAPIFPSAVESHLAARYGAAQSIEPLSGLSGANVWRVRFAQHSFVVKMTTSANEPAFYGSVAPTLRSHGIGIPALEWSVALPDATWLVLEDIPRAFPKERWLADSEQIAVLRRLHQSIIVPWPDLPGRYQPRWIDSMTDATLAWMGTASAAPLRPILDALQIAAQPLFAPTCPISGDPNPMNWGLREDGTLVLFDWERFSRATPAIDVAITVPGLGDAQTMRLVAARYLDTHDGQAVAVMTREIAIAKAWTVVELFSFLGEPAPPPHAVVAHLCENFPVWLQQVARPYL